MIFSVCNPENTTDAQNLSGPIKILCGFSIGRDSPTQFLTNSETIKKRLYRARTNLREWKLSDQALSALEIKARSESVLKNFIPAVQ